MQHGYQSSEKTELLVCQHPPRSSLPCHTHLSWHAYTYIWRYIQDPTGCGLHTLPYIQQWL